MSNDTSQQLLSDIKKTNEQAEDFIKDIDKELEELDMEYAKVMLENDIKTLELAKKITEDK